MKVNELFEDKFICFKNKMGATVFWNENALGYTGNFKEAGVYDAVEVVEKHKLHILTSQEIKKGLYKQYTHFATTLSDAVKFFQ